MILIFIVTMNSMKIHEKNRWKNSFPIGMPFFPHRIHRENPQPIPRSRPATWGLARPPHWASAGWSPWQHRAPRRSQGSSQGDSWPGMLMDYPLVMTNIAIENGHLCWIYPLKIGIFHSYVTVYWRVISHEYPMNIPWISHEYPRLMIHGVMID